MERNMTSQLDRITGITEQLLNALNVPAHLHGSELAETPARVARAWLDQIEGYKERPEDVLGDLFQVSAPRSAPRPPSSMVQSMRPISFASTCMHHLQPFFGVAKVAYIPTQREDGTRATAGAGRLVKLVNMYARRLTMQERIAEEVAHALLEHAHAEGALVILNCRHTCLCGRGIRQRSSEVGTLYGVGTLSANYPLHVTAVKMLDPTPRSAV
jgi:GTP cyclohydrolase I